jgi:hypothetical protein
VIDLFTNRGDSVLLDLDEHEAISGQLELDRL